MNHPFPLEVLKALSQQRNDQATRQLGKANRRFQDEQSKLSLLENFRKDYQARYDAARQQGNSSDTLTNFRHFLDRLDEAVHQQRGVLEQVQQQVRHHQGYVCYTHRQVQSMAVLSDRHEIREQQTQLREEQKMNDEHVGQKTLRRMLGID